MKTTERKQWVKPTLEEHNNNIVETGAMMTLAEADRDPLSVASFAP